MKESSLCSTGGERRGHRGMEERCLKVKAGELIVSVVLGVVMAKTYI